VWKQAEVPSEFQMLADKLHENGSYIFEYKFYNVIRYLDTQVLSSETMAALKPTVLKIFALATKIKNLLLHCAQKCKYFSHNFW